MHGRFEKLTISGVSCCAKTSISLVICEENAAKFWVQGLLCLTKVRNTKDDSADCVAKLYTIPAKYHVTQQMSFEKWRQECN